MQGAGRGGASTIPGRRATAPRRGPRGMWACLAASPQGRESNRLQAHRPEPYSSAQRVIGRMHPCAGRRAASALQIRPAPAAGWIRRPPPLPRGLRQCTIGARPCVGTIAPCACGMQPMPAGPACGPRPLSGPAGLGLGERAEGPTGAYLFAYSCIWGVRGARAVGLDSLVRPGPAQGATSPRTPPPPTPPPTPPEFTSTPPCPWLPPPLPPQPPPADLRPPACPISVLQAQITIGCRIGANHDTEPQITIRNHDTEQAQITIRNPRGCRITREPPLWSRKASLESTPTQLRLNSASNPTQLRLPTKQAMEAAAAAVQASPGPLPCKRAPARRRRPARSSPSPPSEGRGPLPPSPPAHPPVHPPLHPHPLPPSRPPLPYKRSVPLPALLDSRRPLGGESPLAPRAGGASPGPTATSSDPLIPARARRTAEGRGACRVPLRRRGSPLVPLRTSLSARPSPDVPRRTRRAAADAEPIPLADLPPLPRNPRPLLPPAAGALWG